MYFPDKLVPGMNAEVVYNMGGILHINDGVNCEYLDLTTYGLSNYHSRIDMTEEYIISKVNAKILKLSFANHVIDKCCRVLSLEKNNLKTNAFIIEVGCMFCIRDNEKNYYKVSSSEYPQIFETSMCNIIYHFKTILRLFYMGNNIKIVRECYDIPISHPEESKIIELLENDAEIMEMVRQLRERINIEFTDEVREIHNVRAKFKTLTTLLHDENGNFIAENMFAIMKYFFAS